MANLTNTWAQEEDVRVIAGGLLRISAPEMAERFLPGRTPEAINMRLSYLRRGDYNDRGIRRSEDIGVPQVDASQTPEAMGSHNLLLAILGWAAKHGAVPPGLTVDRTLDLCRKFGIDVTGQGLKLRREV